MVRGRSDQTFWSTVGLASSVSDQKGHDYKDFELIIGGSMQS